MTPRRPKHLVRPWVITGGRARPERNTHVLDVATLVTAVPGKPLRTAAVQPECEAVLELCRGFLTVAEVAAHLGQPLTVTRVLLGDLIDSGHLVTRSTRPAALAAADIDILERVLDGLRAL